MNRKECPEYTDLESYATGVLSESRAMELELHLDDCPECCATMAVLESSTDELLMKLRQVGKLSDSSVLNEPGYKQAVDAICRLEFSQRDSLSEMGSAPLRGSPLPKGQTPFRTGAPSESVLRRLGEYDLLEEIGRGGMGVLYRARHRRLCREVAVKVLTRIDEPMAVARFHREMQAAGRVRHPHVVSTTDAGESDGVPFLVMDLIDGLNLGRIVALIGQLGVTDACEIIRQAAAGLQAINEHHLVHRDLKPSNLMVDVTGTVRILDLGLALIQDLRMSGSPLTPAGAIMGSIHFMAPEQAEDTHKVDVRADIYSLGATLHTLLTGQLPLKISRGAGRLEQIAALSIGTVTPLKSLRADIPEAVERIVADMMARRPEDRCSNPVEIVERLKPFCDRNDLAGLLERARTSQTTSLNTLTRDRLTTTPIDHLSAFAEESETSDASPAKNPPTLFERARGLFRRGDDV